MVSTSSTNNSRPKRKGKDGIRIAEDDLADWEHDTRLSEDAVSVASTRDADDQSISTSSLLASSEERPRKPPTTLDVGMDELIARARSKQVESLSKGYEVLSSPSARMIEPIDDDPHFRSLPNSEASQSDDEGWEDVGKEVKTYSGDADTIKERRQYSEVVKEE